MTRRKARRPTPLEAVVADLRRAGFDMSGDELERVANLIGESRLELVDVLATLRDAVTSPDEHAFRAAPGKGHVALCLAARAEYARWTVGIARCDAAVPTPAGCLGWKLARYRRGGNNAVMLERWCRGSWPDTISLKRALPVVPAARPDARERALLRQIAAAPDDDEPRLVYADWLAEHDPDRAEFIVLSCRAAASANGAERRRLEKRTDELRIAHRDAWEGHLAWVKSLAFRRGFVHAVEVDADELLEHPELFDEPGLAELTVSISDAEIEAVVALPGMERLEALTIDDVFADGDEIARRLALARPARLARLRRLCVSSLDDEGALALADPGVLPGLTTLVIEASSIGSKAMKALRRRPLALSVRW